MSRRRQLSEEERALWRGVARSITPLPLREAADKAVLEDRTGKPAPVAPPTAGKPESKVEKPESKLEKKASPPLAPLDRRLRQRVGRGREPIEARLDLHGMTQNKAHDALRRFLHRAQAEGMRTVLVVTGKGTSKGAVDRDDDISSERGVLKRQVPLWLALPEFRALIIGFDDAHVSHGGQGALYVRVRRRPSNDR
jgi:DNA-nicking Smr family endonuclease